MNPRVALLAAASVLAATASPALADGPPGSVEPNWAEPAPPTRTVRYGTHVFLADVAVFAASALVTKLDDSSDGGGSGLGGLVSLGYFAGGPLVHLHHKNPSGARKSLAARALLPVAGAVVGMALASADSDQPSNDDDILGDDFDVLIGMVLGAAAGSVTAMVLDWTVFSKKTVEVKPAGIAVAPAVGITPHGVSLSLSGTF